MAGLALLAADVAAGAQWVQHHFLPDFSMSPFGRTARVAAGRSLAALAGLGLLVLARRLYRLKPGETARTSPAGRRRITRSGLRAGPATR